MSESKTAKKAILDKFRQILVFLYQRRPKKTSENAERRADPAPDVGKDRMPDNYCPPHGIYMATQSVKPLYYAACRSEKVPC